MEFPEHMAHSMLQTIYSIPSIHSIHSRVSPHPVHCAMRSANRPLLFGVPCICFPQKNGCFLFFRCYIIYLMDNIRENH